MRAREALPASMDIVDDIDGRGLRAPESPLPKSISITVPAPNATLRPHSRNGLT